MICEICGAESNVIYVMRKEGFICDKCARKIRNSKEKKLQRYEKRLKMYKKYGRWDEIEKLILQRRNN